MCKYKHAGYLRDYQLAALIHELKSPLAAIQGALSLLQEPAVTGTRSQMQDDYLSMIDRNSHRLNDYIEAVLETISWKQHKERLSKVETDIHNLCAHQAHKIVPVASTKGISVSIEKMVDGPLYVRCDPDKVGLVISNLLSNAVKYTPEGQIRVQTVSQPRTVTVSVQDSGVGIPTEDLPRVFDRSYRAKTSIRTKGIGFGLSIAKFWVEAHGGRIGAVSLGQGRGSQFWFELPKN